MDSAVDRVLLFQTELWYCFIRHNAVVELRNTCTFAAQQRHLDCAEESQIMICRRLGINHVPYTSACARRHAPAGGEVARGQQLNAGRQHAADGAQTCGGVSGSGRVLRRLHEGWMVLVEYVAMV